MSVHPDRGAWVVRWRQNGTQRARRFKTHAEALAFDEGVSGGAAKPRSSTPNVYPYETSDGTRWRYSYRDSRARASSRRGFPTEPAAAREREDRMGRVRQGGVYVSRMTFGEFFPAWPPLRRARCPTVAQSRHPVDTLDHAEGKAGWVRSSLSGGIARRELAWHLVIKRQRSTRAGQLGGTIVRPVVRIEP